MAWRLYCPSCGWTGESEEYHPFCPKCGGPLEARGTLPVPRRPVLGEGDTPLVEDGRGTLYKLEYLNPTGSFKDRGTAYSIHLAHTLDYKCVVEDSSGNTAISTAAYAGWYGMRARVHVPLTVSPGKLALLRFMGAEVSIHSTREEASEAARRDAEKCFYIAHSTSPVFLEGMKTLGRELAEAARDRLVFAPASSGSLIVGIYRGMLEAGIEPRIVAVQSPLAASLEGRVKVLERLGSQGSLLDALVLRDPPRLRDMVEAATEGVVIVGDEYVRVAWRRLALKGLIVEPSSASVYAAADALDARNSILILTGSGLKYHDKMAEEVEVR
ncbi:MAG: pyridoxal-phosphate dependent enzyme [Desulfurococcales archaeon]|nr:pyridoxal-phosphate dependent enzyme [Desulfurococcales archaeon]